MAPPSKTLESDYSRTDSIEVDTGMVKSFQSVFNGNMKRIHDAESSLASKRSKIVELANEFMVQIAVFEHPLNNFEAMDPKIYDGIVKPKVLNMIREYVQTMFNEMEGSFMKIQTNISLMKENKSETNFVIENCREVNRLLDIVDDKTKDIETQLGNIKKSWFQALNLQEEQNTLSEKIVLKMDKISKLQDSISTVIDVISMNIQQVSLDGESNDMTI